MEKKKIRQMVHRSPMEIYGILQDFKDQKGKMTTDEFCKSRGVASGFFYACLKAEKLHGKYSKSSRFAAIQPEDGTLANRIEAAVHQRCAQMAKQLYQ